METFEKIRQWSTDRNIILGSTYSAQYEKLLEEVGELGRALMEDNSAETKDAIGDIIVVLTNIAAQRYMKVEDCVDSAYETIKDRKGQMINGVFVKES